MNSEITQGDPRLVKSLALLDHEMMHG